MGRRITCSVCRSCLLCCCFVRSGRGKKKKKKKMLQGLPAYTLVMNATGNRVVSKRERKAQPSPAGRFPFHPIPSPSNGHFFEVSKRISNFVFCIVFPFF